MAYTINTNITSLQAQEYLRQTQDFQSKTINRVTSGLRILSSGDDAAGLAIANGYRSDSAVLTQGVRNANDGLSTLQTIDGGINNISQLLDRARTLAAQSASGTFNGDRDILNSEFQSVVSEIDRQAQAIGLDEGGTFAKSLSVFIGGGRANSGVTTIDNGSVAVDLSQSTVDAKSLGLQGVAATGVTGTDIGTGSASTSVQDIVGDTANLADLSNAGYTEFKFFGPGFSDSEGVTVAVNISGVTDTSTLVEAVNAAIDSAGNGSTSAATAFSDAGIRAAINTDANGAKQLSFSSSDTAFQVKANDQMANALLGNYTSSSNPTGTSLDTTVQGVGNTTAAATTFDANAGNIVFRIQGAGITSPVDVTLSITAGVTTVQQAVDSLSTQIANNSTLKAAGITLDTPTLDGANPLQLTSTRGEKFDVMVTGDVGNELGFGTFVAGDAGEIDYVTRTGSAYDNTSATTAQGDVTLEFSINGAASNGNSVAIDLEGGDATGAAITSGATGDTIDTSGGNNVLTFDVVDATGSTQNISVTLTENASAAISTLAAEIDAQISAHGYKATVSQSKAIVIESEFNGTYASISNFAGTAAAGGVLNLSGSDQGTARTGGDIANALNQAFAADTEMAAAGLEASFAGGQLTVASNNNTYFRVNSRSSAVTANVGFGIYASAASFTGNTVSNAPATSAQFNAGGSSASTAFTFSDLAYGSDDQTLTISANDSTGAIQAETIVLHNDGTTAREGRDIDSVVDKINQELQQTNNTTLQKVLAVKVNDGGTEKIQFLSTLDSFNVSVGGTSSSNGFGSQGATDSSTVTSGGSTASIDTQSGAQSAVNALAAAVADLGAAQAVVGKGQNRFNFAINLAQTQLNNLAASESRIRDADLAAEAANMTKAQILQQAGIAALSQANSAPQAVLSLLQG